MVEDVENPSSSAVAAEVGNSNENGGAPSTNFQVVTTVPTNEEDVNDVVNDDIENRISPVVGESGVSFEKPFIFGSGSRGGQ